MNKFMGALAFVFGILILLFVGLLFLVNVVLNYDQHTGSHDVEMAWFAIMEVFQMAVGVVLVYFGVKSWRKTRIPNVRFSLK